MRTTLALSLLALIVWPASGEPAQAIPHAESINQKICVDFTNERRILILSNIADFYGLGLKVPDELSREERVKGFKVVDVGLEDILDLALAGTGFSYAKDKDVISIIPGRTDARAAEIWQRKLHELAEDNATAGVALRRLVLIEDPAKLQEARKRILSIMARPQWTEGDLIKALDEISPNQPPLRMPVSGTPAADAPVAPPPSIAGR